jgi:bacteriorhodopsin
MEPSKYVQFLNASLLAIFSVYLLVRGDIPWYVTAIPLISSSKYFFLSQNQDTTKEKNQWSHYLAWFLTTPIMLYLIFSLNNFPLFETILYLILNAVMILAGYIATIQMEEKKLWDWFTLGCLAFVPIVLQLLEFEEGIPLVLLTLCTWTLYPIIWFLSYTNDISIAMRNVGYSSLDFTSKAGLVFLYLVEIGKFKL